MKCLNCKSLKKKKIISIGKQPLSGIFQKKKNYKLKKYSLDLFLCKKCNLVQLGSSPSPKKMFSDYYGYQTSISSLMKDHLFAVYKKLKKKKIINKYSSILDIGSNDGTFLNFFDKTNDVYGIDPTANKFKKFYKPNIKIISNFFTYENLRKYLKNPQKKFDLISSFAMFYDVNDPNKFCKDVFRLLSKNGIWILELSYFPLLLKNLTYDQICHEHVTYYTLGVFKKIAESNHLRIVDVFLNEINGGSIEIICVKNESKIKSKNKKILRMLKDERKINSKSFINFNDRINKTKKIFQFFLSLNSKKKIIGYGASTKGNVVLNHCEVNNNQIKEISDGNRRKIGKFTPGTNIKIISKERMRLKKPDYLVVLIWSFRKEVIKQEMKFLKAGGKLVFLLPKFHIVSELNYKDYMNSDFSKMSYKY